MSRERSLAQSPARSLDPIAQHVWRHFRGKSGFETENGTRRESARRRLRWEWTRRMFLLLGKIFLQKCRKILSCRPIFFMKMEKNPVKMGKSSIFYPKNAGTWRSNGVIPDVPAVQVYVGICGLVGRATTCVGVDVGSIPTCSALEVWQWTFGSRTVWLVNKSAG